ncbi:diguanylate cyclase domain-containing protein [Nakamurella alba]|uniref:diguanylate cyclase domain-containing protein n=1 Tax=Nakamurella alba TaxID=2665158 RepID=UPI0018AA1B9F|nr:sensor domain-containing diguanylate cyclase [Nakamurella alba]
MPLDSLGRGVAELAALATSDFEPLQLLHRLCEVAAEALDVDGVGVMRLAEGRTTYVHATGGDIKDLELLQEALQEGPCRDALDSGQLVKAGSIDEMAWPRFECRAAELGVHAVLALPLIGRGRTWGTLDLYWAVDHTITDDDIAAAELLAHVAVSFLAMDADRAELRAAHEDLALRAMHDQLTGLPNRGLIHELIEFALAAARRNRTLVTVLFLDLDGFKAINDTFGHRAGDEVLVTAARRLLSSVREMDRVSRLAGDEFLILVDNQESAAAALEGAHALAGRIHELLARPLHIDGVDIALSASIGAAVTSGGVSVGTLVHRADTAMYEAKSGAPGGTVIRLLPE